MLGLGDVIGSVLVTLTESLVKCAATSAVQADGGIVLGLLLAKAQEIVISFLPLLQVLQGSLHLIHRVV